MADVNAHTSPRRYGALAALAVACVVTYLVAGALILRYGAQVRDLGWEYALRDDGWYVASVDPDGPAAGALRPGDRVVAVQGDPGPPNGLLWVGLRRVAPGTPYTLRVAGPDGEHDVTLEARLVRTTANVGSLLAYMILGLSYLAVGLAVLAARPDLPIARMLVTWCLLGAVGLLSQTFVPVRDQFGPAALGLYFGTQYALLAGFALCYRFYHRFPEGRAKPGVWPAIEYLLFGALAVLSVVLAVFQVESLPPGARPIEAGPWLFRLLGPFNGVYNAFIVGTLFAECAVLLRTYVREREPDQRRRVKWAVFGSLAAFVPFAVLGLFEAGGATSMSGGAGAIGWPQWVAIDLFALIPVSFGYAVVKHRLFDIEVVVRRGLQYLLARNALRALAVAPVAGIAWTLYRTWDLPLSQIVLENSNYLYGLAAAGLALRYRGTIAEAIDRRFFRQAYDRERVLAGLADRIRRLDTDRPDALPEVAALVMGEVGAALYPERTFVVFRRGDFAGAPHFYGSGDASPEAAPAFEELAETWRRLGLAWRSHAADELPPEAAEALRARSVDLVVPVHSAGRRAHGFLVLGERRSETPYTETDRRLLDMIADQLAATYETFLLREQKDQLAQKVAELEVSQRSALEAREAAVEASRAKSVFLANMSHELRTPLNAVIGFSQLLERSRALAPEDRESLRIIQRSGEHLLGLINDVLSLSKIEAGKLTLSETQFDLPAMLEAVRATIALRAEAKGLELVVHVDGQLPRSVEGDEGKLRQVLLNLLGNAVKFTERGRVVLRARWADGRADFEVEDTGHGISEAELGRLFEAFTQTESGRGSKEGTGLGLVISRQIVRLMGGEMTVRSRAGVGTTFAFDMALPPGASVATAAPARRVVGLAPGVDRRRLLVADDTPENRLLLVRLLTSVGFDVRDAANGRDALDVWRAWRPDLIFMDVRMPVMDGPEATRAIRAAEAEPSAEGRDGHAPVRIVALTASAFEHDRDLVLADGADDFVTKPFREETIFEKLAEHLGARFVYEDAGGGGPVAAGRDGALTPGRIAALPAAIVSRLNEALLDGDLGAATLAAGEVGGHDAALGEALSEAVRRFEIDELLTLLEQAGGPS